MVWERRNSVTVSKSKKSRKSSNTKDSESETLVTLQVFLQEFQEKEDVCTSKPDKLNSQVMPEENSKKKKKKSR